MLFLLFCFVAHADLASELAYINEILMPIVQGGSPPPPPSSLQCGTFQYPPPRVSCNVAAGYVYRLDLWQLQLSGTLPSDIATGLPNLQWIDAGRNALRGAIPSFAPSLKALLLADNQFDALHHDISTLSVGANLRKNKITGTVPEITTVMSSLTLNDNAFSGELRILVAPTGSCTLISEFSASERNCWNCNENTVIPQKCRRFMYDPCKPGSSCVPVAGALPPTPTAAPPTPLPIGGGAVTTASTALNANADADTSATTVENGILISTLIAVGANLFCCVVIVVIAVVVYKHLSRRRSMSASASASDASKRANSRRQSVRRASSANYTAGSRRASHDHSGSGGGGGGGMLASPIYDSAPPSSAASVHNPYLYQSYAVAAQNQPTAFYQTNY